MSKIGIDEKTAFVPNTIKFAMKDAKSGVEWFSAEHLWHDVYRSLSHTQTCFVADAELIQEGHLRLSFKSPYRPANYRCSFSPLVSNAADSFDGVVAGYPEPTLIAAVAN